MKKKLTRDFLFKIENLKSIELTINRLLLALLICCFIATMIILSLTYVAFDNKERKLNNDFISNTNTILQANISESLSIIANYPDFVTYLKEGAYSRQLNEVSMLLLFESFIDNKTILGLQILNNQSDKIFEDGVTNSDFYIDLKLCYLNNRLNDKLGSCDNRIKLFINKNAYISKLHEINQNITTCKPGSNCFIFNPFNNYFGSFQVNAYSAINLNLFYKTNSLVQIFFPGFLIFLIIILLLIVAQKFVKDLINAYLAKPIQKIETDLKLDKLVSFDSNSIDEIRFLVKEIQNYQEHKVDIELGKNLAQVAHDIRSPLIAIQSFIRSSEDKLQEKDRLFLRNAFNRIDEISQNLVARYKGQDKGKNDDIDLILVAIAVFEIMSEKRFEHANPKINFIKEIDDCAYFSLVHANKTEFRRMLSNLINNAVSATAEEGNITVSLKNGLFDWVIEIQDQGLGMTQDRINDLLSTNPSAEAKIGLGLQHAKEFLTKFNGNIAIESILGEGTIVTLSLPKAGIPTWLCNDLYLQKDNQVIVVDDDQTIHDTWHNILVDGLKMPADRLTHFTAPDAFLQWYNQNKSAGLLILCDYEFINYKENGLDVLSCIDQGRKVLVTSHYSEEAIIKSCAVNDIKLLPKHLVPFLKIQDFAENEDPLMPALIFIDDDQRNIDNWVFFAEMKQIKMVAFTDPDILIKAEVQFNKDIPIYIDLDLDREKSGIAYARDLYELGFKKIYLATGTMDADISQAPWIIAVVEKRPPFLS